MPSINNILSALADFLNEAQNLGVIKEFNLVPCEQQNEEALVKAKESFSSFLEKIGYASTPVANPSSSVTDYIERTDKENKPESNIGSSSSGEKAMEVDMQDDKNEMSAKTEAESAAVESPNWKLVQITVDSNEMKRRIDKFISRKKGEGAEWNVQEFCGRSYIDEQDPICENLDSCARVDAAFVQRRGLKSHIKVSKVRNACGPQNVPQFKKIKTEPIEEDHTTNTINERLSNMENHLKLKSGETSKANIFTRIKALEDRILFLEGTSPEYFNALPNCNPESTTLKKKNISVEDKAFSNFTTEDVLKKIQKLKATLKCKVEPS